MNLHRYTDIHTHRLDAGADCVINLPAGMSVPADGAYSVGIHPWDSAETTETDIERIASLATDPRVVAIGETGIDMLRGASPVRQREIFIDHVRISEDVAKPLIIHAVRSLPQIMQIRKQMRPTQLWIIHGYRGNAETARQLMKLGIAVSLGSRYNPEVETSLPPEWIFRESDAPDKD